MIKNIEKQILKLRSFLEEELGGTKETTRILTGIIDEDLKVGSAYAISSLRAISFLTKNQNTKKQIEKIIEEISSTDGI